MTTILTGNKDTDLLLLSKLNDKDLLNICIIENKYINKICRYESFWRNRFINKFGKEYLFLKPNKRTWRNHYLKVIHDLDFYKDNPWSFFETISWNVNEGIDNIQVWDFSNSNISIIKNKEDVEESWKNNYYYLTLGNELNIEFDNGFIRYYRTDTHFTPKDILEKVEEYYQNYPLFKTKFFVGFETHKNIHTIILEN